MNKQTPVVFKCDNNEHQSCELKIVFNKLLESGLITRQCDIIRMMLCEYIESKSFRKLKRNVRSDMMFDITNLIHLNEELSNIIARNKEKRKQIIVNQKNKMF